MAILVSHDDRLVYKVIGQAQFIDALITLSLATVCDCEACESTLSGQPYYRYYQTDLPAIKALAESMRVTLTREPS